MSSRHVEITLQAAGGVNRWVVTDLQSTHGMFVRVSRTVLADKAEFLVGNGRYRFDAAQPRPGPTADHRRGRPQLSGETQGWADGASPFRPPAVTELVGNEIGNRMLLVKPEYWIGADATCQICRSDDPFCEPRHVRLFRAPSGSWYAEHNKTQNGLWLPACPRSWSISWSAFKRANKGSSSKSRKTNSHVRGDSTCHERVLPRFSSSIWAACRAGTVRLRRARLDRAGRLPSRCGRRRVWHGHLQP